MRQKIKNIFVCYFYILFFIFHLKKKKMNEKQESKSLITKLQDVLTTIEGMNTIYAPFVFSSQNNNNRIPSFLCGSNMGIVNCTFMIKNYSGSLSEYIRENNLNTIHLVQNGNLLQFSISNNNVIILLNILIFSKKKYNNAVN